MRILLTNDDGIDEEGLAALAEGLKREHEVWVVAPDRNRSGVSHGITMHEPLKMRQYDKNTFSCSGLPADCVISGVKAVLPAVPDVVISGINRGPNIGSDIIYSGTAAAARQAALFGIPALAFSLDSDDGSWRYAALTDFAVRNLNSLKKLCIADVFLNINAKSADSYNGCKLTAISLRQYQDTIHLYTAPNGQTYSFFESGCMQTQGSELSDFQAVQDGYVSVSPVFAHPATVSFADISLDGISV